MKLYTKIFLLVFLGLFMSLAQATADQKISETMDDSAITANVKTLFVKDKLVNPFDITVTTENGEVTLEGMVNTDMEYEKAVILAESVDGVVDVESDDLKIKDSKQPIIDTLITAKIKGKVLQEKLFENQNIDYWSIQIETKSGIVYMSGKVKGNMQKERLEKIAQSINGVKSVENKIIVSNGANN